MKSHSSFRGSSVTTLRRCSGAPSEAEGTHLLAPRSERKYFAIFRKELPTQDTSLYCYTEAGTRRPTGTVRASIAYPTLRRVGLLNERWSRKSVLISFLSFPFAAAAAARQASAAAKSPAPASKSPQTAVAYQITPRGPGKCSGCKSCLPGAPKGQCQVVAGDISPDGWCVVYSAKA